MKQNLFLLLCVMKSYIDRLNIYIWKPQILPNIVVKGWFESDQSQKVLLKMNQQFVISGYTGNTFPFKWCRMFISINVYESFLYWVIIS